MRTNLTIDYDVAPAETEAARAVLIPAGGLPSKPAPPPQRADSPVLGWLAFVVVALMLFLLLGENAKDGIGRNRLLTVPTICIEVGGAVATLGLIVMSIGVRLSRRATRGSESYEFTDDGVTRHMTGQWQHWPWSALHSFAETDALFVLRTSPQEGLVFPKRLFARPEEADALRTLATLRLSKPVDSTQDLEYERQ